MSQNSASYYLPIYDADLILEGCNTLLRNLIQRIIENQLNGTANYTIERGIIRGKIIRLVIEFTN